MRVEGDGKPLTPLTGRPPRARPSLNTRSGRPGRHIATPAISVPKPKADIRLLRDLGAGHGEGKAGRVLIRKMRLSRCWPSLGPRGQAVRHRATTRNTNAPCNYKLQTALGTRVHHHSFPFFLCFYIPNTATRVRRMGVLISPSASPNCSASATRAAAVDQSSSEGLFPNLQACRHDPRSGQLVGDHQSEGEPESQGPGHRGGRAQTDVNQIPRVPYLARLSRTDGLQALPRPPMF